MMSTMISEQIESDDFFARMGVENTREIRCEVVCMSEWSLR